MQIDGLGTLWNLSKMESHLQTMVELDAPKIIERTVWLYMDDEPIQSLGRKLLNMMARCKKRKSSARTSCNNIKYDDQTTNGGCEAPSLSMQSFICQ